MHTSIHSWADGYLTLRDHAVAARGAVELDSGARWPRTTGDDVVTIAAMFDLAVRDIATPGTLRRWHGALDKIKHEALPAPDITYAENRSFWSTLEVAAIALDEAGYPLPAPMSWHKLLREIDQVDLRNAADVAAPFGPIAAGSKPVDVYLAEYHAAGQQRGTDSVAPPAGFGGGTKPIPRTTNADVLALATYWDAELGAAKSIMGTAGTITMWKAAMADVNATAKNGAPADVYPKNNQFWRAIGEVAVQVETANEAPTTLDIVKGTIADLPSTYEHALGGAASVIADAGHAVKEGVLAALKKPLYVAGGLLGLYLITRTSHHAEG